MFYEERKGRVSLWVFLKSVNNEAKSGTIHIRIVNLAGNYDKP